MKPNKQANRLENVKGWEVFRVWGDIGGKDLQGQKGVSLQLHASPHSLMKCLAALARTPRAEDVGAGPRSV